jgi:hypothetical protein
MDVVAGQTFSAPLSVKVSAVRTELPAIAPAGRGGGLPPSFARQRPWLLEQAGGPGPGHVSRLRREHGMGGECAAPWTDIETHEPRA